MDDIADLLPKQSETVLAIFAFHKAQGDAEPERGYLGASIIGHECDRFLWLSFRGVIREDRDGRIYRLLETGDLAEERFMRELRAIGCEVYDRDERGEQLAINLLGGHFSGHLDAVATGVLEAPKTPHVVETKTAKAEQFAKIVKDGVRKAKPMHFAQMQVYMGGMNLTRALYLVVNKDDDDLYSERVEFERSFYEHMVARATRVISTSQPPTKVTQRADDFRCKRCPGQALCWGDEKVAVPVKGGQTCRSCCHSTAELAGGWSCAKFGTPIESTDVGAECPGHLLLPGLVSFAEPTDSDADWIEMTNHGDGAKWRLGSEAGQWGLQALAEGRGPLEAGKALPMAKPDPTPAPPRPAAGSAETSAATSASSSEHIPWTCGKDSCDAAYCWKHVGHLFVCATCGQAEAELDPTCPGPDFKAGRLAARVAVEAADLLGVDFSEAQDQRPLMDRWSWADNTRLWDGPVEQLEVAMRAAELHPILDDPTFLPIDTQDDDEVNACVYSFDGSFDGVGDYMIVHYKQDGKAAIWKGVS